VDFESNAVANTNISVYNVEPNYSPKIPELFYSIVFFKSTIQIMNNLAVPTQVSAYTSCVLLSVLGTTATLASIEYKNASVQQTSVIAKKVD